MGLWETVKTYFNRARGILVILAIYGLYFLYLYIQGDSRQTNPDIFPAFRAIEQSCLKERWPHETVRCHEALEMLRVCMDSPDGSHAFPARLIRRDPVGPYRDGRSAQLLG